MYRFATLAVTLFAVSTAFAQVSDPPASEGQATFEGLGFIGGKIIPFPPFVHYQSDAWAVSADGSVVVGVSTSEEGNVAFRWENGVMNALGSLGDDPFHSQARGVSADGSIVVGYTTSPSAESGLWEAFRWEDGEMTGLGDLVENDFWSEAWAVSTDGSVITGRSLSTDEGFRWVNGEMTGLGLLEGGWHSEPFAMSADGSVIVGSASDATTTVAFRWTEEEGIVGLGVPPGPDAYSMAEGVSADGSVVVGMMSPGPNTYFEPFRWTEDEGFLGLGILPGAPDFSSAVAWGVSADGSIVVGLSSSAIGHQAFIWTEEKGMLSLMEVLENDYGLDLNGWHLTWARRISDDGTVIIGFGINPDGYSEAWRVVLPKSSESGPENDHIADATIIPTVNASYEGTNVNATLEDSEPEPSCTFGAWTTNFSVWWTFTVEVDANRVTIDTFDSGFDTILSLHRADDLSEVACDDDTNGLQSEIVDAPIVEGETYLIRVAGYDQSGTNQGEIHLNAEFHTVSGESESETFVTSLTAPSPNPVRGTAALTLTVDREQNVTVEVFDVMGRRVQTLYEGNLATGTETILTLDATRLSAGMYIIRATGENFHVTRRMTVIR